mgnify:CR=1 FL=1
MAPLTYHITWFLRMLHHKPQVSVYDAWHISHVSDAVRRFHSRKHSGHMYWMDPVQAQGAKQSSLTS